MLRGSVVSSDHVKLALRRFPSLCTDGLYPYPGAVSQPIDPDQVEAAIAFLSILTPTNTPRIDSGSLKHFAENWIRRHGLGSYISRGAITAAAVTLRLTIKRCGFWWECNSAVTIGVSRRDLRRVNIAEPKN